MGLRDFVDRYIVSVGPAKPDIPLGEIDVAAVPLQSGPQLKTVDAPVAEAPVKALSGIDVPFEKVYEAARITVPVHKFTVEKAAEMLANPKLAALPPEGRAAAVLVALESQGVKSDEIIADAVKKDKALDLFEKVQLENLNRSLKAKADENAALAAKIAANEVAAAELKAQVAAWVAKKAAKEEELFAVISHFTTANPITRSAGQSLPEPAAPPPSGAKIKVTDLTGKYGT